MLEAIVDELDPLLRGQPLEEVSQLESHRFLLRFSAPPFPRLHVCLHPGLSSLHLTSGIRVPSSPTELAVGLTRELQGRVVTQVVKQPGERLVRIRFGEARLLVVELMGKASNLLLLDERQRILRFARSHQGEFRRPVQGAVYQPPQARPGLAPPWVTPEALSGLSGLLARELDHEIRRGVDPSAACRDLLLRAAPARRTPLLYAPAAPADLPESLPLTPRNLFAAPFALRHAEGLSAIPFDTMNEAAKAEAGLLMRHMAFEALHASLAALLRQESRRLVDLTGVVQEDLARAQEAAASDRRRGELILSGMHRAIRAGGAVRVPDPYDPSGGEVEIPIDPRLGLAENAARLFHSARRADRTLRIAPGRLAALHERLERVGQARRDLESTQGRARLEELEARLQGDGLVRAFRRAERAEVGRRAEYVRVREFRTSDGFTILVGRTGADNDHLTFKVAAPHDLWLHAAGHPGAHVILRNPRRLARLPDAAVREAAGVAAWYSKGKGDRELDVHVAFRRHVRKGRGMSPGMVVVKRHTTVRAAPALPAGTADGPDRAD